MTVHEFNLNWLWNSFRFVDMPGFYRQRENTVPGFLERDFNQQVSGTSEMYIYNMFKT